MGNSADRIEFYDRLTDDEKFLVNDNVTARSYSKGEVIHSHNGSCIGLIYIIEGGIRVGIYSEEGRFITLYKLGQGDTCVVSAACVLHEIKFESAMIATDDTKVMILNARTLSKLVEDNIYVRSYSYEIATRRFSTALFVLQEIIMTGFDVRLARYLIEESKRCGSTELHMTQESIATEVNSAREVVARMLRQFVLDDMVKISRGTIILTDTDALSSLAGL